MATAPVAYESSAEARKARKAVKPLRWHRMASGLKATGVKGSYHLTQRSPDRRRGIFPWTVKQKGVEIKVGGFDTAAEGKEFASLYDAGLCGQPPVVVQVAPGMPAGTYRGTVAETPEAPQAYKYDVAKALAKMQVPDEVYRRAHVVSYMSDMAHAGVDPEVTAAVIAGTLRHSHQHDAPGKHVEMSEAGEDRGGSKYEDHIFRGQRFVLIGNGDVWRYEIPSMGVNGVSWWIGSRDEAMAAAQRSLGAAPGFSVAVEARRYKKDPGYIDGWTRPDGKYYSLHRSRNDDSVAVLTLDEEFVHSFPISTPVAEIRAWANDYDASDYMGASEAKRRLWQPDPSSGYFITHSSLTRDNWLVKGNHLVFRDRDRSKVEAKARELTEGASEEARRPKGPRRR